jgi:hypothetical protein
LNKPVLAYIDDQPGSLISFKARLESTEQLEVHPINVGEIKTSEGYSKIIDCHDGIIIDFQLIGVQYKGLDIAAYIRRRDDKKPLWILTQLDPNEDIIKPCKGKAGAEKLQAIDLFIEKRNLEDDDTTVAEITRILRATGRYREAVSTTSRKFRELIMKKIEEKISADELKELMILQDEFDTPYLTSMDQSLVTSDDENREIDKLVERLDRVIHILQGD